MKYLQLFVLMLMLSNSHVNAQDIIINEFQADPAGDISGDANGDGVRDGAQDEFVELYNNSGADLDVSGWTIADGFGVRHTFPAASVIPGDCSIVVFGGGTPSGVFGNSVVQIASSGGLGLNNGGDDIIVNDGLSDVAAYTYGSEGGNDEALTLDPDVTGLTFVGHSVATGSGGDLFSPGTLIDGSGFAGCAAVVDTPPSVSSTTPIDAAVDVAVNSDITVNFNEAIDATASAVTITCDAMPQPFSGLPFSGASMVLTPDADLPFDASCTVDVLATQVTDQDGSIDNMSMDYSFGFTVASDTPAALIINEFQADPDATDGDANGDGVVDTSQDEFVELYNNSGADLDVSGWTLSDGAAVRHTFPAASVIPANCSLVVFGGGTPTGTFGDAVVQTASAGFIGLNNGGDTITVNDGLSDVAAYTYGSEGGNNEALTLDPDVTGLTYVGHSSVTGSGGSLFSPGTRIDGTDFAGCGVPAPIDIIVNEYQADPDASAGDANGDGVVDTSQDEFIEIYNNGSELVDISGWTVADGVAVRHTFAPGTMLDACKSIVVFGGGTPTGSFGGSQTVVATEGFLGLNNGGDSIIINDGMVDQVNLVYGASSTNQSYTLDPDITGLNFVEHSTATGSGGALFSPGTRIDGSSFVPCGDTPTPPRVNNTLPINGAGGVDLDTNIEVNFSEIVNATVGAATLTCGVDVISFAGLPLAGVDQLIINPDADLPNGETCTLELIASEITDLDDMVDELDGNGDGTAGDNFSMQFIAGFPEVEIYEIQGAGLVSPYSGITVRTLDNIVTALDTNGFYMQTPDVRDDADPLTSSGIYVYTQSAPTVLVGDQVDLTGEIVEFFGLTEFTNPNDYILTIDSSGNPLPTAIMLDASFPSPDPTVFPCGDESLGYECYEGMHFVMPQGFVSAASVGFFGSDRDDVMVNAGSARAMREPGIDYPGIPGLPEFDGNPELIEMSVDALTLPLQPLAAGSEIALEGVISFGFNDYELQPSLLTMINENVLPGAVRDANPDEVTLASANLFRLFNDVDDPGEADDDQIADPAEYNSRLLKLAKYFIEDMKAPMIIALQEIENTSVLLDLAAAISQAGGPTYVAILVPGNDVGGINVAYMYQAGLLSNVMVTQLGAAEINSFDGSLLHDRPPLRLEADVALSSGSLSLNVLVVHMRSRSSIDSESDGDRVRNKRLNQANSVAVMIENIMLEDPDKSLYVVGDYNAFEFTDGYVDVVGQITGQAVEADNLLWTEPLFATTPLTQGVQTLASEDQYSFVFGGSAQVLDNAIMNDKGLMNLVDMQFVRGQADASVQLEEDDTTSLRSTDHDGFVLYIFEDNDLIFKDGFE
ncbi:MAG: lamin tail domain-containing protein [Marinicella sp.]